MVLCCLQLQLQFHTYTRTCMCTLTHRHWEIAVWVWSSVVFSFSFTQENNLYFTGTGRFCFFRQLNEWIMLCWLQVFFALHCNVVRPIPCMLYISFLSIVPHSDLSIIDINYLEQKHCIRQSVYHATIAVQSLSMSSLTLQYWRQCREEILEHCQSTNGNTRPC